MPAPWTSALVALLLVIVSPAASYADAGLLRTIHALDDARGYCLDIAGPPEMLRLDDPLQAHTCKYGAPLDDQRFERIEDGTIRAPMYGRCLAAAALEPGARLLVRACAATPTQRWSMAWGRLSPASRADLCVAVAGEKGEPAGTPILISPVYRHRDVLLERCGPRHVAFEMDLYWITVGGQDPLTYFARWPGRFPLVHVKDSSGPPDHRMTDVGAGRIPWTAIFAHREQAGIRHAFIEHDAPADPLASVKHGYEYLRRLDM